MKRHIMSTLIVLAVVVGLSSAANWAVLVAGSNTWYNYRHQADVFHAYQVLIQKKFDPSNIIVMVFDDIANNSRNPFPGQVFNKPTFDKEGVDVYKGVKIDYSGADVTPATFLKVLEGKRDELKGVGSGRVLDSTANDNVFMFFSDHGAPGLIAFPSTFLYAKDLIATFNNMKGHFKKFTFYLETCESGSMFANLTSSASIYAVSAANPTESSYGTYCSPNDVVAGKRIGTCLGDLFSVNFIEDTENNDITQYTLQQQFERVREITKMSHVMQWGDLSFTSDKVSEFLSGRRAQAEGNTFRLRKDMPTVRSMATKGDSVIDSRLMKVKILSQRYGLEKTEESYKELREEMRSMQTFDEIFAKFSSKLQLTGHYSSQRIDYDCLKNSIDTFQARCGKFTDYGLRYIKYFAESCERYTPSLIESSIQCHSQV